LHQKYRLRTETKWPNDVMVNTRKICGILAETTTSGGKLSYVVLGIGIKRKHSYGQVLLCFEQTFGDFNSR